MKEFHSMVKNNVGKLGQLPLFFLPDATGTTTQIQHLASEIERKIVRFTDRSTYTEHGKPIEFSLKQQAFTYLHDIVLFLQENKEDIYQKVSVSSPEKDDDCVYPIPIVGYSGGGALLNEIMAFYANPKLLRIVHRSMPAEYLECCPSSDVDTMISYLKDCYLKPIYLDSVSPGFMNRMSRKAFAEHLVEMVCRLRDNYKKFIKEVNTIIESGDRPNEKKWPYLDQDLLQQIEFVGKKLTVTAQDFHPNVVLQSVAKFQQSLEATLSNHRAYLLDAQERAGANEGYTITKGAVIATQSTASQVNEFLGSGAGFSLRGSSKSGHEHIESYLGYQCPTNWVKFLQLSKFGIDHYSMLEDKETLQEIADFINYRVLGSDDKLVQSAKNARARRQYNELMRNVADLRNAGFSTLFVHGGSDQAEEQPFVLPVPVGLPVSTRPRSESDSGSEGDIDSPDTSFTME